MSLAGYRPVNIAGIAHLVMPATPVALRYQVDWPASLAKFGYRRRSIWPVWSSSDRVGSSSRRTKTTGAPVALWVAPTGWAVAVGAGRSSSAAGDASRNTSRKTIGAGEA